MNTSKKSVGEKWVLYTSKRTQNKYSLLLVILLVFCTIVTGTVALLAKNAMCAILAVMSFSITIVQLERRYFYQIIQRYKKAINRLEEKLNEKSKDSETLV